MSSVKPQEPPKGRPVLMRREQNSSPVLQFSPTAWAKLLYFRDKGHTEIGGFGISASDDLLRIEDFVTVKQDVTMASVSFEDEAVADLFDAQVDVGNKPEQFARVWLHTHPGDSPTPSLVDEETFARVFDKCQWAVMFIIARSGKSYARLRFNTGPGGQVVIPVEVDYSQPFEQSDHESWDAEFKANIKAARHSTAFGAPDGMDFGADLSCYSCPEDWLEELEAMEPEERQMIMAELSARPDLWDDAEVIHAY